MRPLRRLSPRDLPSHGALLAGALALLTLALAPAAVHAATITVSTTDDQWDASAPCSLREAIGAITDAADGRGCVATAAAYGDGDQIELAAGTYALTLTGADEDGNATGDLDVGDPLSEILDVTIVGAGSAVTFVDGGDLDRIFDVLAGHTLRLRDLTVRNGTASAGGGIYADVATTLELERVVVAENRALHPTEPSFGGGIMSNGSLSLIDSTVRDNIAEMNEEGEGGLGGGLAVSGALTITGSTISGNVARRGSTLVHGWGGAIYTFGDSEAAPEWLITNSTITGNRAMVGGGIFLGASSLGELVLSNVTITENHASQTAGGVLTYRELTLRNTVIAQNHSFFGPDCGRADASIAVTSGGYNFIGNADAPQWADTPSAASCLDGSETGDRVGTGILPLDAGLRLLADAGGPTWTHALDPQSPLRDAGDPDGCKDETGVTVLDTDQRAAERPVGDRCDIGAFEAPVESAALDFYTVTPCRILDTRTSPPSLAHGVERDISVAGTCGVPAQTTVASLNATVVTPTAAGALSLYPRDTPPTDDLLFFRPAQARANNVLAGLADFGVSATATFPGAVGSVGLILDVNGYFVPNQPPVAVDDAFSMSYISGATALDVLANDTDAEGDPRLIAAVSQPVYGVVTITGGGTGLTYDPTADYCSFRTHGIRQGSPDSFVYELSPGGSTAVVTVELTCEGCLAAGTTVWTERGQRPIEDIVAGDRVWARDEVTGETRLAPVEWVTVRPVSTLLAIDIGAEVLHATAEHPFWTGLGWTQAGALVAGDVLLSRDGTQLSIRRIDALSGPANVYNLHVGELHTFFVGPSGVLVHNK